jgi:hypothetical protein
MPFLDPRAAPPQRSDVQLSHGICSKCRDGVVKDRLEIRRGRA